MNLNLPENDLLFATVVLGCAFCVVAGICAFFPQMVIDTIEAVRGALWSGIEFVIDGEQQRYERVVFK